MKRCQSQVTVGANRNQMSGSASLCPPFTMSLLTHYGETTDPADINSAIFAGNFYSRNQFLPIARRRPYH